MTIEELFEVYFNSKLDFSLFKSIKLDDSVTKIELTKTKKTVYKCSPELKSIHTFLSNIIFDDFSIREDIVFSYRKEKKVTDAVKPHAKNKNIYLTDIKDFFPSITKAAIINEIRKNEQKIPPSTTMSKTDVINRIAELCTIDGHLPIGFSSSPSISNFCLFDYDNRIKKICEIKKLEYTRYADDIIISSNETIHQSELSNELSEILSSRDDLKLKLNKSKTKIITRSSERHILGVSILNDGKLTVSKRTKIDIETKLYLLLTDRTKLIDYSEMDEKRTILSMAGTLSQIYNIDKEYLIKLRKKYGNSIISKLLRGKELI